VTVVNVVLGGVCTSSSNSSMRGPWLVVRCRFDTAITLLPSSSSLGEVLRLRERALREAASSQAGATIASSLDAVKSMVRDDDDVLVGRP